MYLHLLLTATYTALLAVEQPLMFVSDVEFLIDFDV